MDKEEFRHFRVGKAIDTLLTDKHQFDKLFFIFTQSKPSGLAGKFIDNLPLFALNEENEPIYGSEGTLVSFNRDTSLYEEAYNKAGYKIPIRTVIQNFWNDEKQLAYYRAREQANGKEILSTDEMDEIQNALAAIKASPNAPKYFTSYTQVPIYFTYKDKDCKCLLDGIYIDEDNKEVHPFDLKSTGSIVTEFDESFWKYGYYRQCAFYMTALYESGIIDYYRNLGYTIMPFKFIVASKKDSSLPALKFKVSEQTLYIGTNGGLHNGKQYKGFNELFDALLEHQDTGDYSCPVWIKKANYTFTI